MIPKALGFTVSLLIVANGPAAMARSAPAREPLTPPQAAIEVPPSLLYDQTDFASGTGALDTAYPSFYADHDSEGADDFVVTWGEIVEVVEVRTVGITTGTPISVHVRIYPDAAGVPGALPACDYPAVPPGGTGSLVLELPTACVLHGGVWWLAIQVLDDSAVESHFWSTRTVATGWKGKWRNPGGGWGFNCPGWRDMATCGFVGPWPDFLFQIYGYIVDELHDQTDGAGVEGVLSQNFSGADGDYSSEAADDFVVDWPGGWELRRVETIGSTSSFGTPDSVNVTVFPDAGGVPGPGSVCSFWELATDDPVDFGVDLPGGCPLDEGHYWLSVQANGDFAASANYWKARTPQIAEAAVWRNPLDGHATGCTEWTTFGECFESFLPDLRFRLRGAPGLIFEDNLEIGTSARWSLCSGCSS